MNQLIDKELQLKWNGTECLSCGSITAPIFAQGFCKSCFFNSAHVGDWVIRPELSKAHLNEEDRDLDYEKRMQLQPHIVYLAYSGGLKVGVTRKTQIPTRWIDQGATAALPIVETPNRYLAGVIEVSLKEIFSDKTNRVKMLTNVQTDIDWEKEKLKVKSHLDESLHQYLTFNTSLLEINYPITQFPKKIKTLNLIKTKEFKGKLTGIKGQYLFFDNELVFNVRSNEGNVVLFNF